MYANQKQILNLNMTCTAILLINGRILFRLVEKQAFTTIWAVCDDKGLKSNKVLRAAGLNSRNELNTILGSMFGVLLPRALRGCKNVIVGLRLGRVIKKAEYGDAGKADAGFWTYDSDNGKFLIGQEMKYNGFVKRIILGQVPLVPASISEVSQAANKPRHWNLFKQQILITKHAINRASTRILGVYRRRHAPGEGLADYLVRMAKRALAHGEIIRHGRNGEPTTYLYKGLRLVISEPSPNTFQLVTVMRYSKARLICRIAARKIRRACLQYLPFVKGGGRT